MTTSTPELINAADPARPGVPMRWRLKFKKFPKAIVVAAAIFLIVLTLMTIFADYLPFIRLPKTKVPKKGHPTGYAWGPGFNAWFGTDGLNRDVFAKCIYGARTTLQIGVYATVFGLVVGSVFGILAGYFRGWVDRVISIITDCLLALPPLLLAIILVNRLDDVRAQVGWLSWFDRKWQIVLTLGTLAIAPLARIVRAQTLSLREREFVLAARSLGASSQRVIFREILPNLVPAMVTVAFTGLGILIAAEGALAFLGLGVAVGTPTWGKLINENKDVISTAWWAPIFPSLMLFVTVFSFNILGDELARRFDIRQAGV
jgi:peptide/nickel transport system permease protein